jgi:2-iminobutanoate/2-iminopropanoate deaminase
LIEQFTPSRIATFTLVAASALVCACSSTGGSYTIGGRPLIYSNSQRDDPSTIHTQAGIVYKGDPVLEEEQRQQELAKRAPARAEVLPERGAPAREAPPTHLAMATPSTASSGGGFLDRYTQASRYGDLLFVSGQIAVDPRSGQFNTHQDVQAQTQQALENVRTILEANRLTMANVVSTTVYISDISRLSELDGVYHQFFKGSPPARTVVEVSKLPRGALVEIAAVAGR